MQGLEPLMMTMLKFVIICFEKFFIFQSQVNVDSGETVSMFDRESPVLQHSLIAISALLAFLLTTGVVIDYLKKQENRKLTMQSECMIQSLLSFLCPANFSYIHWVNFNWFISWFVFFSNKSFHTWINILVN